MVQASSSRKLDVHLYRAKTRYRTKKDGTPDFNLRHFGKESLKTVYDKPLRVKKSCQLASLDYGTATNCPQEIGVSGSPYATKAHGVSYVTGVVTRGTETELSNSNSMGHGSAFINSTSFCSDYEKLCDTPCVDINEVLPKSSR